MLRQLSLTPVRRRARFPGHGEPAEPLKYGGRCREPSLCVIPRMSDRCRPGTTPTFRNALADDPYETRATWADVATCRHLLLAVFASAGLGGVPEVRLQATPERGEKWRLWLLVSVAFTWPSEGNIDQGAVPIVGRGHFVARPV